MKRFQIPPFKPYDYVVIIIGVLVIIAFVRVAAEQGGPAALVQVRSDAGDMIYSLQQNQIVTVPGPLGDTTIEISGGTVRFLDSPCRDKICITSGVLERAGQWAACLPNRVFVTVSVAAGDELEIDGSTF
jgi:hypothetical protein